MKVNPLLNCAHYIYLQLFLQQLMAASRKQVEELQQAHDQKIKEQKILEEKRRLMESQQTKVYMVKMCLHLTLVIVLFADQSVGNCSCFVR